MRIFRITRFPAVFAFFLILGCAGTPENKGEGVAASVDEMPGSPSQGVEDAYVVPAEWAGEFRGAQPSYFLKNRSGEDMVINGRKVSVPATDHVFTLSGNGTVTLVQSNPQDNSSYTYSGTVTVLEDTSELLKFECAVSDGGTSSPTYILSIRKADGTVTCSSDKSPEFGLQKMR